MIKYIHTNILSSYCSSILYMIDICKNIVLLYTSGKFTAVLNARQSEMEKIREWFEKNEVGEIEQNSEEELFIVLSYVFSFLSRTSKNSQSQIRRISLAGAVSRGCDELL